MPSEQASFEGSEAAEGYSARRAHAYRLGETRALQRVVSADAYLFLYKELVRLSGDRSFCWPGLDFLGSSLDTSSGTLKRWLRELEQADLIKRVPRPGGQTTITYITAYLTPERVAELGRDETETSGDEEGIVCEEPADLQPIDCEFEPVPMHDEQSEVLPSMVSHEPLFFVPPAEIINDPDAGSDVIHHTVKIQKKKNQKVRSGVQPACTTHVLQTDPAVATLLETEGIFDVESLNDLKQCELDELEAIRRYLDRQTNVRSRPALFAWLAKNRFGKKLLNGRAKTVAAGRKQSAPIEVHQPPINTELNQFWQSVLDTLRTEIPPETFATWLAPTQVLDLDAERAVVSTPNVFVRDELKQNYHIQLEAAASQVAGRPLQVEVVIGRSNQ